jgi:hypothetical protein
MLSVFLFAERFSRACKQFKLNNHFVFLWKKLSGQTFDLQN